MRVLLLEDDRDVADTVISVLKAFYPGVEVAHLVDGTDFRKGNWRTGGCDRDMSTPLRNGRSFIEI